MDYPWPEVRYRFTGGKPPARRKVASKPMSEPSAAEYRQFLLRATSFIVREEFREEAIKLLSRGVPRNGEQG